jgi:tetratricopeptide (TPR) repeat protein
MALYRRQLGASLLMAGEPEQAAREMQRSLSINPNDDLAWRALALAQWALGDAAAAEVSIGRAVRLQRSDSANLLLAARAQYAAGDSAGAQATLSEVAQAWPEIVAAPLWPELLTGDTSTTEVLQAAAMLWADGHLSPEPLEAQPLLIQALVAGTVDPSSVPSAFSPTIAAEYLAVMSCSDNAASLMHAADASDRRQAMYWALRFRQANVNGGDLEPARTLFTIMTGDILLADGWSDTLNPLNENGTRGARLDRWGYRRQPIEWPPGDGQLPSQKSGLQRLLQDPADVPLGSCQ